MYKVKHLACGVTYVLLYCGGKMYLYLQHDVSREAPTSMIIRGQSYTLISEYRNDDIGYNQGHDVIKDDLPGIRQICRFHMIPTE